MEDEKIIATIQAFKSGKGREEFWSLFLTNERLVAAKNSQFNTFAWSLLFGLGSLFVLPRAKRKAVMRSQELSQLPINNILESDSENFQISYNEITNVVLNKPTMVAGRAITFNNSQMGSYQIGLLDAKAKFDANCKILQSVFGEKFYVNDKNQGR